MSVAPIAVDGAIGGDKGRLTLAPMAALVPVMAGGTHGLGFGPYGVDNDGIAGRNDEGGNEEEAHCHESDVQLPLPIFKLDPTLRLTLKKVHPETRELYINSSID